MDVFSPVLNFYDLAGLKFRLMAQQKCKLILSLYYLVKYSTQAEIFISDNARRGRISRQSAAC